MPQVKKRISWGKTTGLRECSIPVLLLEAPSLGGRILSRTPKSSFLGRLTPAWCLKIVLVLRLSIAISVAMMAPPTGCGGANFTYLFYLTQYFQSANPACGRSCCHNSKKLLLCFQFESARDLPEMLASVWQRRSRCTLRNGCQKLLLEKH